MANRRIVTIMVSMNIALALPLIPGGNTVASTFDPSQFDVLAPTYRPGFLPYNLTYNNNQQVEIDGITYIVADQFNYNPIPSGSCSAQSMSFSSLLELSQQYSAAFSSSTSGPFDLYGASSSWVISEALGWAMEQQFAGGVAVCSVTTHSLSTLPAELVSPTQTFTEAVTKLLTPNPLYHQNPTAWTNFFGVYDVAVPISATFGGGTGAIWAVSADYFNASGYDYVNGQMSASLFWSMSASGGGSANVSGATAEFLEASHNMSAWRGGSCSPPECTWSEWLNSLPSDPTVLEMEYASIAGYIALVDENAANGAADAIGNVTALRAFQGFFIPMFTVFAQTFANVSVPDPQPCITGPKTLPVCQSRVNGYSCCTMSISAAYPNASVVEAESSMTVAAVEDILLIMNNALQAQWVSESNATAVLTAWVEFNAMWFQSIQEASCTVTSWESGQGSSPYCPQGCGWIPQPQGQCKCPPSICYAGCQSNSGMNYCPPICSPPNNVPQSTITAYWPTAF